MTRKGDYLKSNNGNGQYLSDIQPGTKTSAQLSRTLINNPFQGKRFSNYIEVDVNDLKGIVIMKYLMVDWLHNFSEEPIKIYSEIDEQRNEIRKVEIFRDGKVGYATEKIEFGGSALSVCPLPEIEEIASDQQFKPFEITKEEFETIWAEKVNL